jgi:hypothetical protein
MYYDVTACADMATEPGYAIITIQNTGSTLLAVNHIKLTGDATATALEEKDLQQAAMFMAAPIERAEVIDGVVTPIEDETTPDDTTTPDSGDDNTSGDSGSFIEQLISMIVELIKSIFTFLPAGEVM